MVGILFGIFLVLHGLVHMLYFGQSVRLFELQPGMVWPEGSWVFTQFFGNSAARNLASGLLILATIGFVVGGIGIFTRQAWWQPVIVATAVLSIVIYLLFWDGGMQHLDNKGGVGILINLTVLVSLLVFRWPKFAF